MPASMTKRERVERTMAHQETDRVPLYDLLRNDAAFEYFSGEKLPTLSADPDVVRQLDRIAAKATGFLDMTRCPGFGPVIAREWDYDGIVLRDAPFEKTSWVISRPFHDEHGAAEFLKKWIIKIQNETREISQNPARHREAFHKAFLETQSLIDGTVNTLVNHGVGIDDLRCWLGFELFAYVEAEYPHLISEAMDAMMERNIAECHAVADPTLSPVVLTYGDIACKDRLLHSPAFLRREFFPRLKQLNDAWHEHDTKCLFHSDGYLMDVMDDLVDAGIDGLNPIETLAGMSLKEVREKYGKKLFLAGGIDMSQLLSNGSPDEVREVCRQAVRDAYPGFFMGSTTETDNSCRLENILAMVEVAMEGI